MPFLNPIKLNIGDLIKIKLSAKLISDEYIWSWKTKAYSRSKDSLIAEFNQSTFFSGLISQESIIKRGDKYNSEINDRGKIDLLIINLISKGKKNIEIAEQVIKNFPDNFKNINESLPYVGNLSEKYRK